MWEKNKSGHLFFTALMSILFVRGELGPATEVEPPMWVNINASLTMNTFDMLLNIHVDSLCLQRRVCSQRVCSDLDDSVQSSRWLVEQNDVDQMLPCNKSEAFSHSLQWAWQSAVSASPLAKLLLLLLCMSVRASIITALGGLSLEGEAQAQLKGTEGRPYFKQGPLGGLHSSRLISNVFILSYWAWFTPFGRFPQHVGEELTWYLTGNNKLKIGANICFLFFFTKTEVLFKSTFSCQIFYQTIFIF